MTTVNIDEELYKQASEFVKKDKIEYPTLQNFIEKAVRDNYHCTKCGFQPTYKRFNYTTWDMIIIKQLPDEHGVQAWEVVDKSNLIVDHITPIAIGGDEWDMNNLQTLCSSCNKIKTARDMRLIAIERKIPLEQVRL